MRKLSKIQKSKSTDVCSQSCIMKCGVKWAKMVKNGQIWAKTGKNGQNSGKNEQKWILPIFVHFTEYSLVQNIKFIEHSVDFGSNNHNDFICAMFFERCVQLSKTFERNF